jgi:hypothetical protein
MHTSPFKSAASSMLLPSGPHIQTQADCRQAKSTSGPLSVSPSEELSSDMPVKVAISCQRHVARAVAASHMVLYKSGSTRQTHTDFTSCTSIAPQGSVGGKAGRPMRLRHHACRSEPSGGPEILLLRERHQTVPSTPALTYNQCFSTPW